jgi:TP901 family phage tail tape measure protein
VVVSNIQLRVNSTQAVKALNSANVAAKKLNATLQRSQGAMKSTQGTLRGMASSGFGAAKGMGAAAVSVKGLGAAFKAVLGPLGLVLTGVGAVTAGLKGFVEADKARAAVRTLGVDAKALEDQLVGVVANTKGLASSNQLLAASYDVASAGFSKAADITKILEASVFGAVGGMTDIATVSDAATSVMNAFGLTTDSVAKIVDGFIQTQNDGKIVVGQYASQIGRVAPIAAAAGVGIDELNAAISTVTAQGVPVESTFSGINQVIASIVKPTAEAAKAAERLGLDFSSAAIKTKGFGGFLEDVIQKTGGSEVEITKLFGSVDALKALMPLINDDLVRFNQNLDNQKNATGAAEDAASIMGETVSSQISRIVNSITTLVRGLDQVLGPAIKGILDLVNNVLTAAVKATDALTKMFRMNAARKQAREEMGGRMGRGTVKPSKEEIEARALEIYNQQIAASAAATKPQTVSPTPQNNIVATGGAAGGGKSKGKTPLERQQEAAEKLSASLENQTTLASALTEQEKKMLQLKIDKQNIDQQFPQLAEATRDKLKEQLETLYAQENVTQSIKDQRQKDADAIEEANKKAAESAAELKQFYESVGSTIQAGIVDGIMGAIDGSKSLQESLSGILKQLGGMFLNAGIGGLGKSMGIPGFGAEGGYASGATNAVIGEAGPEYIIPENKMRESMARYARGARGSAVIPENGEGGTNSEGGAAASSSLDVRFNVERINSVDYVTASEFQAGIAQAAKKGAAEGERRAIGSMRNSSAVRRRVGI